MKTLIVLWIKWTGMVKTKHIDFTGDSPAMPCQNLSWIMGLMIYGEGRTQIPLSSPSVIGPFARSQDLLKKILQFQERICFFFLKTQKNNLFSKCPVGNSKSSFKENTRAFSKTSTIQEIRISKPKKRLWNLYKKKISNQKSNQWLKIYKINFINKKTNKEMVLNFVLTLGRSRMAKKAPKHSSEYLNFLAKLLT